MQKSGWKKEQERREKRKREEDVTKKTGNIQKWIKQPPTPISTQNETSDDTLSQNLSQTSNTISDDNLPTPTSTHNETSDDTPSQNLTQTSNTNSDDILPTPTSSTPPNDPGKWNNFKKSDILKY